MKNKSSLPSLPPRWIVRAIQGVRSAILAMHDRMFPGNVVLYEKFQYFYLLPCLYVTAELNVAGLLQDGEKPLADLARKSGTDAESLYRILRVLASHGIFRESRDRFFSNTRLSKPLMDKQESLRHMLRHHLGPLNWQITGDLLETVKTGKDGFNRKYGKNIYDYLTGDPDSYAIFDQSMSDLSSLGMAPLLQSYNFSNITTLADVGGGEGFLLANILQRYPSIQGIWFDLPVALEKAEQVLQEYGVRERVSLIEGNFLESVPSGADGYLVKNILHNWDDSNCITLLSNIRKVLPENGKVIIVEMIVPPGNRPSAAKMIDIQMLTSMPGGKERTREEFEALFRQAGLTLFREYPTIAPVSVLEARRNG
ncbi:MAG: methyltransferase [Bacteroidales bacterium]|nr:methyltransferase [Bacteroidales bacterium]